MRFALGLLLASAAPALADPAPIGAGFAPIQPSGISAELVPFIAVPPESPTPPTARINYVNALQDGTGRMFINDVNGVLYVAGQAGGTATPYLDLRTQNVGATVGYQQFGPGFSGFAFNPNFNGDPNLPGYGKFYTSTNIANTGQPTALGNGTGPNLIELREWTTATPAAPTFSGTSRVVMDISGYADEHSNATIAFNPTAKPGSADYGNLYMTSGDGHYNDADQNAQRLDRPQGKILRINPLQAPAGQAYTVPADNPFVSTPGALPEVWAYGLRFPQSFSWDPKTGTMYINDLGQAVIEEVDVGKAGANYGWSQREGTFATGYVYGHDSSDENIYPLPSDAASQGFTDPIAEYDHSEGNALGSGFLYRGSAIPALDGKYVMADIVVGRLFVFDPTSVLPGQQATLTELTLTQGGQPIDITALYGYNYRDDARLSEDPDGNLLLALKSNGEVYKLEALPVPEPASAALLCAGSGLIGLARWRRAASRRPAARTPRT